MMLNRRYRKTAEEEDVMPDECDEDFNDETTDLMVVNLTSTFSVRQEEYRDEGMEGHQGPGERVQREDTEAGNEFD